MAIIVRNKQGVIIAKYSTLENDLINLEAERYKSPSLYNVAPKEESLSNMAERAK